MGNASADFPPVGSMERLEDELMDAARSVVALREALGEEDVDRVQSLRWLAPRPPGERDLFSDMAAAEGMRPAVRQIARFWRRARVQLERVRIVDDHEAEVYERLVMPTESLPIVSLVRRQKLDDPWKVVCTNEAYDERFVLWLPTTEEAVDDMRLIEALDENTQILMDGADGVMARDDWLVHVRGPVVPARWPENLPGETGRVVELIAALAPAPAERRAQLKWLLSGARAMLEPLGGHAVYLERERRALMPGAIEAIALGRANPRQSVQFWTRILEASGVVYTDGLRLLGLPEIEVPRDLFEDPTVAHELIEWLARTFVQAEEMPSLGTELSVGSASLLLWRGRRGPRRGRSYGRWGAIAVTPSSSVSTRGSRSRLRVPDEIAKKVP